MTHPRITARGARAGHQHQRWPPLVRALLPIALSPTPSPRTQALVVYRPSKDNAEVARDIIRGPRLYVPTPSEWVQEFAWGKTEADDDPEPFSRLPGTPGNVYIDVSNVRTADDALLTLNYLMVFQLLDIPQMLAETDDPISAFTTSLCSDVLAFSSRLTLDGFKEFTPKLSALDTYQNLRGTAAQNGCKIIAVVFRGCGARPAPAGAGKGGGGVLLGRSSGRYVRVHACTCVRVCAYVTYARRIRVCACIRVVWRRPV